MWCDGGGENATVEMSVRGMATKKLLGALSATIPRSKLALTQNAGVGVSLWPR